MGMGLREALDGEPRYGGRGEKSAPRMTPSPPLKLTTPDVIVLDVRLRRAIGQLGQASTGRGGPDSGIVVLGREDDDASILEAVEIGAMGHVPAPSRGRGRLAYRHPQGRRWRGPAR